MVQQDETMMWPPQARRNDIQDKLNRMLVDAIDKIQNGPAAPEIDITELRRRISRFDFASPVSVETAARDVIDLLVDGTVHMMHPGYMGLFNPSVSFPGVLADQITATINPQLAVWSHAPAAVEIERYTINAIAARFGWTAVHTAGHFTTGGAEANYTALLMALTDRFPAYGEEGGRGIPGQPTCYVSAESHLAWLKIAHQAGIGRNAVRLVPTDGTGRMDAGKLARMIDADEAAGHIPFFVGATAGTTNAGMIDPLTDIARLAAGRLWFHVDAAWGGAAVLTPRTSGDLDGIEAADTITLDAHKWFAVPMGAGMLLTRNEACLAQTFRIAASYMPGETAETIDPYTHSLQWSRRFIGLKLFLSLASLGWQGYRRHVEHAMDMAARLKVLLEAEGWLVVNDSPLAVLCFIDDEIGLEPGKIAREVVAQGPCWISAAQFEGRAVLRACITSHFTDEADLRALLTALNTARSRLGGQA